MSIDEAAPELTGPQDAIPEDFRTDVVDAELVPADDEDDDVLPVEIEYVTYREPVLSRTGSAAMVVASATARGAGRTARHGWRMSRWFGHGLRATTHLGYRYVRAHDHQEVIGGMTSAADWNKVHQTRHSRWRHLAWTFGGIGVGDLFAWWGCDSAHLPYPGLVAPAAEVAITAALLTVYGRYRLNSGVPMGEIVAAEDDPENQDPFPLAWCRDGGQVEECVSRALTAEGVGTRSIRLVGHHAWGWEIDLVLKGSNANDVSGACDKLDAHFGIKHGGTMPESDPMDASHLTLRLVTDNPFRNMPLPQVHAPNSLDVGDAHHFGQSMDGRNLEIVLEGNRILVIGVSGSAKSTGVLRDLAEVITACHNAIGLEMDPIKDGLREFEGVMAVPPIRGNEACEEWLDRLFAMAEARNRVRNRLQMGDTWVATRERPAVFVIVDEFIFLSKKAKLRFIDLVRIGKQSGIYPIAAGQDATSDAMGDAIADTFTLKVMLAARHDDIPLVFGKGAIARGFRPDRLVPAQNKDIRNDAGQSYLQGGGLQRPVLWGWNEHSNRGIREAVAERKAAGRPWFDDDTLAEANLLGALSKYRPGAAQLSVAERLEGLGTPDAKRVAALLRLVDQQQFPFLPTEVAVKFGVVADGSELQALLSRLVPGATSSRPVLGGVQTRGWDKQVIENAAAALFAPS